MTPHPFTYSRRDVLCLAAGAGAVVLAGGFHGVAFAAATPPFFMPPLPYAENALEPVISARTVSFHYGKHTQGYFDNANKLVVDTPLAGQPLDKVFVAAAKDPKLVGLFRNAAQAWNHVFYWNGLSPKGGGEPTGKLAKAVGAAFGDTEGFRKALSTAAVGQFGSGWAWLVADGGGALKVVATGNADNPLQQGLKPLWVIDVGTRLLSGLSEQARGLCQGGAGEADQLGVRGRKSRLGMIPKRLPGTRQAVEVLPHLSVDPGFRLGPGSGGRSARGGCPSRRGRGHWRRRPCSARPWPWPGFGRPCR